MSKLSKRMSMINFGTNTLSIRPKERVRVWFSWCLTCVVGPGYQWPFGGRGSEMLSKSAVLDLQLQPGCSVTSIIPEAWLRHFPPPPLSAANCRFVFSSSEGKKDDAQLMNFRSITPISDWKKTYLPASNFSSQEQNANYEKIANRLSGFRCAFYRLTPTRRDRKLTVMFFHQNVLLKSSGKANRDVKFWGKRLVFATRRSKYVIKIRDNEKRFCSLDHSKYRWVPFNPNVNLEFPVRCKSNGNHMQIFHMLICLLDLNFSSFERKKVGMVWLFRMRREVPVLHCKTATGSVLCTLYTTFERFPRMDQKNVLCKTIPCSLEKPITFCCNVLLCLRNLTP